MKFWKIVRILNSLIENTLPDWQGMFLSYKDLKKQLKLIFPQQGFDDDGVNCNERPSKRLRSSDDDDDGDSEVTKEVTYFVNLLEEEIDKFNAFFVDKEEYYIIRLKVLQDKVAEAKTLNGDLMEVGREIVDFHGEMVLLENYSALYYIGLVKILKKHDKKSGVLIRMPFIQKVLQEPFFKIDVLNELVKESEKVLNHLFSLDELPATSEATEENESREPQVGDKTSDIRDEPFKVPKIIESEHMENMYVMLATSALKVLKDIRSGSSTTDIFSLPPL